MCKMCVIVTIWAWMNCLMRCVLGMHCWKCVSILDQVMTKLFVVQVCVHKTNSRWYQKCITWLKKPSKGRQAWDKTCMEFGLNFKKLKTLMKPSAIVLDISCFTFVLISLATFATNCGFYSQFCIQCPQSKDDLIIIFIFMAF